MQLKLKRIEFQGVTKRAKSIPLWMSFRKKLSCRLLRLQSVSWMNFVFSRSLMKKWAFLRRRKSRFILKKWESRLRSGPCSSRWSSCQNITAKKWTMSPTQSKRRSPTGASLPNISTKQSLFCQPELNVSNTQTDTSSFTSRMGIFARSTLTAE